MTKTENHTDWIMGRSMDIIIIIACRLPHLMDLFNGFMGLIIDNYPNPKRFLLKWVNGHCRTQPYRLEYIHVRYRKVFLSSSKASVTNISNTFR